MNRFEDSESKASSLASLSNTIDDFYAKYDFDKLFADLNSFHADVPFFCPVETPSGLSMIICQVCVYQPGPTDDPTFIWFWS